VAAEGYDAYIGDWQTKKMEAVNRDQQCRLCQTTAALEVHHIDHEPTNNQVDNLITLCRTCHMQYHHKPESERQTFMEVFRTMAVMAAKT